MSPVEKKSSSSKKDEFIVDYITGKNLRNTPEEKVRQVMEKKLVEEYGYPKENIRIEFQIQKGSLRIGPADIVIFHDNRHEYDNIYIVIETKRKERSDGIEQLKSYSTSPSQKFAIWFNGNDTIYYQNLGKSPFFRDIPDIPRYGQVIGDIGFYKKKDLIPATELKSVFESCHNHIYANEGFLKEKVFNEVLKLIFIKMVDERKLAQVCEFKITDSEMKDVSDGKGDQFVERIQSLFNEVKKIYSDVFSPEDTLFLSSSSLAYVVGQLQKFSLTQTKADVKGTAFQTFVHAHERGERGEFFTPWPVVELAVKMLNPTDSDSIIDPACGSGGFLVAAMKHVWNKIDKSRSDLDEVNLKDLKIRYAHKQINGIDINPDLVRVAKMYMILYDDGHAGVFAANSLDRISNLKNLSLQAGAGDFDLGRFNVILTNPPFGTKGKVSNKIILRDYNLGFKWIRNKSTDSWEQTQIQQGGQVPDILFIERCIALLNDGGRMAIVLPDGDLNNLTLGYVRKYIRDNTRILGVVSFPQETFIPHGTGTKTSVLFLQKESKQKLNKLKKGNYKIFTAICEKIGYDVRGRTIFKKNDSGEIIDSKGNPVSNTDNAAIDTDIYEIIDAFTSFKRNQGLSF